jgi:hypothetical protein
MRVTSMNKMHRIVSAERDPLSVVVGFVLDDGMDINTRLTAASICLPYLFPKLSASTVDAKHTITTVDGNALLEKLNDRIERLRAPEPARVIEAIADDADAGDTEPPSEDAT